MPTKHLSAKEVWDQIPHRYNEGSKMETLKRVAYGKNVTQEAAFRKHSPILAKAQREIRRYVAEFIGTFFLVLFICAIEVLDKTSDNAPEVTLITKALMGAFILCGLIYAFGAISGAHFNPVVTLAFTFRGLFPWWRLPMYWFFQLAGATLAALVLYSFYGNVGNLGTTIPALSAAKAFGAELLITFIFVTVILVVAEQSLILGNVSALAIAATFGAILFFGWNISGGSANPARTLGPMFISGAGYSTLWVYIAGPFAGALLAVLVVRFLATSRRPDKLRGATEGEGGATSGDSANNANPAPSNSSAA